MEIKHNRETALSISETRYRTLVETMGDGLSEIDENQVTTYANAMLCRMWGRSKKEILGSRVTKFLDVENRKILNSQLDKRRRGESSSYEIVWNKKDGKKLHTLMTPTPYFDAPGLFTPDSFGNPGCQSGKTRKNHQGYRPDPESVRKNH